MSELNADTERIRLDFLRADLALCFTFANLSRIELEMGDFEAARRALAKAETGQAAITRFLPHIADEKHRSEIAQGLNELRITLHSIRHQLPKATV